MDVVDEKTLHDKPRMEKLKLILITAFKCVSKTHKTQIMVQ